MSGNNDKDHLFDDLFNDGDDAPETVESLREERDNLRLERDRLLTSITNLESHGKTLEQQLQVHTTSLDVLQQNFAEDKKQAVDLFAADLEPVIRMMEDEIKAVAPENRASDNKYDTLVTGFEKTLQMLPEIFNKHGVRQPLRVKVHTPENFPPAASMPGDDAENNNNSTPENTEETLETLNAECDALSDELTHLSAKYERIDRQNQSLEKRIGDAEVLLERTRIKLDDDRRYVLQKFVTDCLPVLDTMDLGLEAISPKLRKSDPKFEDLAGDFERSLQQVKAVFNKHGVREINPVNEEFNETKHEALARVPVADTEPDMVVKVSLRGYELGDRIIRPAKVIVSQ